MKETLIVTVVAMLVSVVVRGRADTESPELDKYRRSAELTDAHRRDVTGASC